MSKRVALGAALAWLLAAIAPIHAQSSAQCDMAFAGNFGICAVGSTAPASSVFPRMAEDAKALRDQFCSGLVAGDSLDARETRDLMIAFVDRHRTWSDQVGGLVGGNVSESLLAEAQATGVVPQMRNPIERNGRLVLGVGEDNLAVTDIEQCARALPGGAPGNALLQCEAVLQQFVDVYAYAHDAYAAFERARFSTDVGCVVGQWDEYLETTRGMTSLELMLNSWRYRRDEAERFRGPPRSQWVVLHPEIVFEYVDGASDGEKFDEALALNLFGVDYWQEDRWYVPSGGSLTLLYNDRADVDDLGIGVQLFFRSVYSIGYSNRDGDDGVFVSVDLLKLFRDRRTELDRFLEFRD